MLTAQDGAEAWNIVQKEDLSLVVADLRMPELNGFELCRKIKVTTETRLLPVIIVTGADDIASRICAFEHGADDILPKPVINEELLARVKNLIRFASLVETQMKLERARAALEKELAIAELKKEQEASRTKLYQDVLFAATGGRLHLMEIGDLALLGENWQDLQEMDITEPSQIRDARHLAEEIASVAGLDEEGKTDAALCVSEAVTNALKFGTKVLFRGGRVADQLRFLIQDDGPGLEHALLPRVTLQKGFSTGASMGMGFSLMLEIMDQVCLSTGPHGTTVLLSKTICPVDNLDIDIDSFLERFSVSLDEAEPALQNGDDKKRMI